MSTRFVIFGISASIISILASGCVSTPVSTRDIAFPYDAAKTPEANYQAFGDVAKKECRSRDIRRNGEIKGEYHCRGVLLNRAIAASGDRELQQFHGHQRIVRMSENQR